MAKILILDEYQTIRDLVAEELAGEGHIVTSVGKPESVPEEVITSNPDLAILDLFIRGKYRWELLEEMRALKPDLPVLIYSGYYPEGDPHLYQIDGFVNKSCFFDELKRWITGILTEPGLVANMQLRKGPLFALGELSGDKSRQKFCTE